MTPTIQRHTYREQEQRFRDAHSWLTKLGVRLQATRVSTYQRDLAQITEFYEAGKINELISQHSFPSLVNSLVEATEFIDLHERFKKSQSESLVTRLRKCVAGTVMTSDESSPGNVARNTLFELSIAATANASGLPVDLSAESDIWLPLAQNPIAIECKRPSSHKKVRLRAKEGFEQLFERYQAFEKPSLARGILALSISKVENDGSMAIPARNEAELHRRVEHIVKSFHTRHRSVWESDLDPRTLAVLLHLRAPCFLEDPPLLTIYEQSIFVCTCDPGSSNREILATVAKPMDAFAKAHCLNR